MASLLRRGSVFYIQFYDARRLPTSRRRSLHISDRALAEAYKYRLERLWSSGVYDPWTEPLPPLSTLPATPVAAGRCWTDVLEAFLESRRRRNRSLATIRTYEWIVGLFFRRSHRQSATSVQPQDLEAFVWDLSVAPGTRANRDRHLRTFFRWATEEGFLLSDPFEGLDRPPQPEKIPRNVTAVELERICRAVEADYQAKRSRRECQNGELLWLCSVFQFAFLMGLRAAEIARLRCSDVDLRSRRLFLWVQKGGRESIVPICRKAADVLSELEMGPSAAYVFRSPRDQPVERSGKSFALRISKGFTRYRILAGIDRPVTFHGLRHGFCTTLAEAGKNADFTQAAARH